MTWRLCHYSDYMIYVTLFHWLWLNIVHYLISISTLMIPFIIIDREVFHYDISVILWLISLLIHLMQWLTLGRAYWWPLLKLCDYYHLTLVFCYLLLAVITFCLMIPLPLVSVLSFWPPLIHCCDSDWQWLCLCWRLQFPLQYSLITVVFVQISLFHCLILFSNLDTYVSALSSLVTLLNHSIRLILMHYDIDMTVQSLQW
jgi:hypothetical protein